MAEIEKKEQGKKKKLLSERIFRLRVMSINGIFYDGKATCIVLPCIDGETAILAGHEEMILAVYRGEMRITDPDGETIPAVIGDGSVQIEGKRVIVLADTVERPEEIDVRRAQEALEIAQEQLRQQQSIKEYTLSQAAMARALNRIRTASKYNS